MNPLKQLSTLGQSPWLDFIKRSLITSGELKRMVEEDGLGGLTSNPAIFEKAIGGSDEYAGLLAEMRKDPALTPMDMYERIAIADIQGAADAIRPVYDATNSRDGYVSLEVSPFLAHDTETTIRDARRLWAAVNRPNLMIKIPGTLEGLPAIEQVIADGINVRQQPTQTAKILGGIKRGEVLPVIGRSADGKWFEVLYKGVGGWVFASLVKPNAAAQNAPVVK